MRDSTPNEVVASCNAVVLLLRTARATSCAPNCDLVAINSGRFAAQMFALGASAFFVEHARKRLGDCRMFSDMCSGCTACLRSVFGGAVNVNVADTHTDAVPHPCIRVVICSHTPFISMEEIHSEQPLVTEIVVSALKHASMMVKWQASSEARSSSSYEEATSGATKEVDDLGVRAPQYPPDLMTCPACSRSSSTNVSRFVVIFASAGFTADCGNVHTH